MQVHQLKPLNKKKARKRIGRGGKKGTYSGRGMKGQKARAGRKPRPGFAGGDTLLIKRLPKKRGQRGGLKIKKGSRRSRLLIKPIIIDAKTLEQKFKKGQVVSPKSLLKNGLIGKIRGRMPKVKILGKSKINKELKFRGVEISGGKSVKRTKNKNSKQ